MNASNHRPVLNCFGIGLRRCATIVALQTQLCSCAPCIPNFRCGCALGLQLRGMCTISPSIWTCLAVFCSRFPIYLVSFLCVSVSSKFDANMRQQPMCGFCHCGDKSRPSEFSWRSAVAGAFAGMPSSCIGVSALRCSHSCSRMPSNEASAA
jgi:hypothetical protein